MKKYKRPMYHNAADECCGELACYFLTPEGEGPRHTTDVVYSDGSHPKPNEFLKCQSCGTGFGIDGVAEDGTPITSLWTFPNG